MRRFLLILAALFGASAAAHGQRLYFTTMIPAGCPIVIEDLEQSKDFGFQSATFLNDSSQTVQSIHLQVTLSSEKQPEEVVDSGHIYISIEPGERKSQDMFLGRVQALTQRAKSDRMLVARAMISVESVEFADGSRWTATGPVEFEPSDNPVRPPAPR